MIIFERRFVHFILSLIPPFALWGFISLVISNPEIDQGPRGFGIAIWGTLLLLVGVPGTVLSFYVWIETIRFLRDILNPTRKGW